MRLIDALLLIPLLTLLVFDLIAKQSSKRLNIGAILYVSPLRDPLLDHLVAIYGIEPTFKPT